MKIVHLIEGHLLDDEKKIAHFRIDHHGWSTRFPESGVMILTISNDTKSKTEQAKQNILNVNCESQACRMCNAIGKTSCSMN